MPNTKGTSPTHRTTSVRFTVEEHDELVAIARFFDMPIATYLRIAALNPGHLAEIGKSAERVLKAAKREARAAHRGNGK